jgi:extracellular factor (EF) 3-hydroxypalmitic acid methyl ester biosynthesis protein
MNKLKDNMVEAVTAAGETIHGQMIRLGRFDAVFDVPGGGELLQASGVWPSCKILIEGRMAYEGRCTVSRLIDAGQSVRCEVRLDENGVHMEALPGATSEEFARFLQGWLSPYQLTPGFKVAVADFEILMVQLRRWIDQVELNLKLSHAPDRLAQAEADFLAQVAPRLVVTMRSHAERFDELVAELQPEEMAVHRDYVFRQWAGYVLTSPFGRRTFNKPLGYAGDYEMMNMIQRNAPEGGPLFSRLMHLMLVWSWPSESVRNRIRHLQEVIISETARVVRQQRRARILNLGCGAAWEVQSFVRETALSDHADFTLLDFNEETLRHVAGRLDEARRSGGRRTGVKTNQISVQHLLRRALQKNGELEEKYDLIYCAGLFDYLSNATCKTLVHLFSKSLLPGGLVIVANMNDAKPFRYFIEWLLDWHLIYRGVPELQAWAPPPPFEPVVLAEPTTVNLFLHVRRPE